MDLPGAETGEGDGTAVAAPGRWLLVLAKKNNGHADFGLLSLLLPVFFSSLSLLLCSAFFFLFFSFHSNEHKLLLFSAFYLLLPLFSFCFSIAPSFPSPIVCLSVEIMREMAMITCYAGWVHAPASMFFLLLTVLLSALSLVTLPSFLLFSVLLPFFFFFFLLSPQVSKGFI